MNAALCALMAGVLALQDAAPPDLPPPAPDAPLTQESTPDSGPPAASGGLPADAPPSGTPGRAPRRRRSAVPSPAPAPAPLAEDLRDIPESPRKRAPRKRRGAADADAPRTRAPRRRVVNEALPLLALNQHTTPMTWQARATLLGGQAMVGGVGALGVLAAAGGVALLARTVDRPAGGLWRVPVPLGGLLPLLVGVGVSGVAVTLGVMGLGYLAERRLAAPAAAMAVWLALATVAAAVGGVAVFWPARESSRTFAIRENTVAITLVSLAVLGPVLSLAAWHAASFAQERFEDWRYRQRVKAASMAIQEDAEAAARRAEERAAREKAAADAEAARAAEEAAKAPSLTDESTTAPSLEPAVVPADPTTPVPPAGPAEPPVPAVP